VIEREKTQTGTKREEREKEKRKKMNGINYHVIVPNLFSALLSLQNKLACFFSDKPFQLNIGNNF
jgi:hypothetical protein